MARIRLATVGAACTTCVLAASFAPAGAQAVPPPRYPAAVGDFVPPGDLRAEAREALIVRHVRLAARLARARGAPMSAARRELIRARLAGRTVAALRAALPARERELSRARERATERLRRERAAARGSAPSGALAAIAACESGSDPRAISPGGRYRGKYQFSYSTWRAVGGTGDPAGASEAEQDRRAAILYRTGGPGHWPVCGR